MRIFRFPRTLSALFSVRSAALIESRHFQLSVGIFNGESAFSIESFRFQLVGGSVFKF
jgi:hypothetical protein